jgi:type IV secretory pathway VirB10-like protein
MKRTFMVGVAAGALLAGLNFASAQSSMERQPAATSSGGGASMEQKGSVEQKSGAGAEKKAQSGEKAKAQDNMKTSGQGQQTAQDNEKPSKAKDGMKGQKQAQDKDSVKGEKKAKDAQKADSKDAQKADSKKQGAQSESTKSGTSAQTDTKSGGGAQASLTTEQKTKIRETVISSSSAPRVTNVNFSVRVGTVVPRTVRFVALPPILIEIYPQWRGYDYFIVEEQIVIIEPRTLRIVAIINV